MDWEQLPAMLVEAGIATSEQADRLAALIKAANERAWPQLATQETWDKHVARDST